MTSSAAQLYDDRPAHASGTYSAGMKPTEQTQRTRPAQVLMLSDITCGESKRPHLTFLADRSQCTSAVSLARHFMQPAQCIIGKTFTSGRHAHCTAACE